MDSRNLAPWHLNKSSRAQVQAMLAAIGALNWQLNNLEHDQHDLNQERKDGIELSDDWFSEAFDLVSKLYQHVTPALGMEPLPRNWIVFDCLPVVAVLHPRKPEQYILDEYELDVASKPNT